MERTWLIQRLLKPHKEETKFTALVDSFSFGGGLRNGGLSDKTFSVIRKIFRFDYMGAAEYEFGAVPEALAKIYKYRKEYGTFSFSCPWKVRQQFGKTPTIETGQSTVYVICNASDQSEILKRITEQVINGYGKCKMYAMVSEGISGLSYNNDLKGWLELDNGFFFFSDKEMFEQTCELFGIEACTKAGTNV